MNLKNNYMGKLNNIMKIYSKKEVRRLSSNDYYYFTLVIVKALAFIDFLNLRDYFLIKENKNYI